MAPPEARGGKIAGNHHALTCTGIGPTDHPVDQDPGIPGGTSRRTQPAKGEFVAQVLQRQGQAPQGAGMRVVPAYSPGESGGGRIDLGEPAVVFGNGLECRIGDGGPAAREPFEEVENLSRECRMTSVTRLRKVT